MKNPGCLLLFSLPFAGVGVFMLHQTFLNFTEWRAAAKWVETPAYIHHLDLESSTDSEGSTTYETVAVFRYAYEDQTYEGSRVSLHGGGDNLGDFHQEIYDMLHPYWQSGEVYRCFVDPGNPGSAMLHRDMRWGVVGFQMVFVVMFGGAGFGLMAFALYLFKKNRA